MQDTPFNLPDCLVQDGRPDRVEGRHVNMPIELGSTMVFDTFASFEAARDNRYQSGTLYYGRYGNAATHKLEQILAKLEGAEMVTLASSGVAAITITLMALTHPGSHMLVADNVYGNTRAFCDGLLTKQGVEVEYFDPMVGGDIADLIRENTAAIMFESPGSGTFEMPDIRAIASAARKANVPSVLDNTWGTPVFSQPISWGVDIVVYSGSKYVSGHSDCMLGITASNNKYGKAVRQAVMQIGDKTGGQEVLLALRGLRTLKLRMEYFHHAGLEMASWLAEQPQVKSVLHPALPSCPGHEFWKRDFTGAPSLFGVIFHTSDEDAVRSFVDALHHFGIGVSWGGYESLVLPVNPVRTATNWSETGQLVRFNIGLEDTASLKADIAKALPYLNS